MPGAQYTIRFKNRSGSQHDFLAYLRPVDPEQPNVQSLAWFAKPVADGADVDFTWTDDLFFVWSEQGALASEITFKAHQFVPADPKAANLVTLSYTDGAFRFGKPSAEGAVGNLTIVNDGTIPPNVVNVGVGMAGAPAFMVPAQPNFTCVFAPHPEYWIAAGTHTAGHLLDVSALIATAHVDFPPNMYAVTATLDAENKWALDQGLV